MFFVTVGLVFSGCSTKPKSVDQIPGAYAREYSFKVIHPETGAEIGMRTIRDTILVRAIEGEFEVSNRKWRKNQYDSEGWQNMGHSDDRPLATYIASFNSVDYSLSADLMLPLYFKEGRLHKGNEKRDESYSRVQ